MGVKRNVCINSIIHIFPDCLYFDICTFLFDLRSIIIKFHTFKWNHIN